MSIIVNGVTIPTNVANALMVASVSVTSVIANGIEVWKQSLFSGVWSGNSVVPGTGHALETSGNQMRTKGATGAGVVNYTSWASLTPSGWVGDGAGSAYLGHCYPEPGGMRVSGFGCRLELTGTSLRVGGTIYFNPTTGRFDGGVSNPGYNPGNNYSARIYSNLNGLSLWEDGCGNVSQGPYTYIN